MKILELPAYFLPNNGGIEYSVYYLAKEFVKLGHETAVISSDIGSNISGNTGAVEIIEGIKVKRVRSFRFLKTPVSFGLKKALLKEDFDLMILHYPHPFFIDIGAYVAKKKNKPYIVHCHGKEIELSGVIGILGKIYNRFFFDNALKNASRIITNTSLVIPQSRYLTRYNSKIITIPHGVDCQKFKKVKTSLKAELNLNNNKIILYVGALRWYKGIDVLIKAFDKISAQLPDVRLVIIGKGEEEQKLKDLALKLGMKDKIIFQGFVEDIKLPEYYSIADLFILPSPTIEESFGLVALEACAAGLPAIVTSGAGVSELFRIENIGKVVKPYDENELADAALTFLKNKKIATLTGKKSLSVVKSKYSWQQIANKYISAFEEII